MGLKELILIFAVMLTVLVLIGTGYASASPPAEEWNRTYEMSGITSVESFQQTADDGYILSGNTRLDFLRDYNTKSNSLEKDYFYLYLSVKDRFDRVRGME